MAQIGVGSIEPAEAMEALEHLLAGPVDQIALVKTTKPIVSGLVPGGEMIQAEEMMTVYPERIPSFIHSLYNYPPLLKHTTALVTVSAPIALGLAPGVDTSKLEDAMQEALSHKKEKEV